MTQWTEESYTVTYYDYEDYSDPDWHIDMRVEYDEEFGWEWTAHVYSYRVGQPSKQIASGHGARHSTAPKAMDAADDWLQRQHKPAPASTPNDKGGERR